MKIFEVVYSMLKIVGLNAGQSFEKHPFNLRNSTATLVFVLSIFLTIMYLHSEAKNLQDYGDGIYLATTLLAGALNFAYAIWKIADIFRLIDALEDVVNTRLENPTLLANYTQTDQKIKKIAKILNFAFAKTVPTCTILPAFFAGFIAYFAMDAGTDALELSFDVMWFPFDIKNPLGYTTATALQFVFSFNLNFTAACLLIVVIAPCLTLIATAADIKCTLDLLNESAKSNESSFEITQQFNQFVQFHSRVTQLAENFSKMVQALFTVHFAWSIESICLSLFAIKTALHENASGSIVFSNLVLSMYSFILVFVSCEFGQKLSNAFDEIDYIIGQMHWYQLPVHSRAMLPLVVAVAQKPIRLRVFGSTSCSREDFKAVINLGFSYYMVLQGFEN